MMDKLQLLFRVQLYVIADKKMCGEKHLEDVVMKTIEGGAQMIQYRDKDSNDDEFIKRALQLRDICKDENVPFIVNDRAEIAQKIDADGIHVGEKDLSIKEVRGILGSDAIIGKTARNVQQAKLAEDEGADYVGLGPVFLTDSKQIDKPIGLDVVRQVTDNLRIPFFTIGGINLNNLDQVIKAGGKRIAVISAIVSSDDVRVSAARLLKRLKNQNLT